MNKNILNKFLLAAGILLFVGSSCKKNNVVQEQDVTPPTYAKFNVRQVSDSASTYFISSSQKPFKLPVGITTQSDHDRTVNFTYTSNSAVQTVQYNAPASITIPAGSTLDTLYIAGIFAGFGSPDEIDTLKITITGTSDVPASPYKSYYYLYLRKECPLAIGDFEGNYDNTYDNAGSYGPYTTTVTPGSITMTGPASATFTIENVWDPGVPVITTVSVDWSVDPNNPVITIPDQEYFGPADVWIRGVGNASGLSPCNQTIELHYDLYYHTTGAEFAFDQETTLGR